jgi:aminomethyltransferase
MTVVGDIHEDHGATFTERGGRRVVLHYGRPERATHAVRNGVGAIEMGYGVVVVEGDDRIEFVDNTVSNRVPTDDGQGCYALLLDPNGRIETDMYVYNAGERLLVFTPPDQAAPLVEQWTERTFIQDVTIREASADFGVFGVHGPNSTEKVASVLNGAASPEGHLSFDRGSMGDAGVTVIASDAPLGEEGYEVVCAAEQAPEVFETLLTRGLNAAPFGYETFETLTLEAGTPLFDPELAGNVPNVFGLTNAVDYEKGCFVGQEVVSKVHNRGRPSQRLVGLMIDDAEDEAVSERDVDADGDEAASNLSERAVDADGDAVGTVTRAARSSICGETIAFALIDADCDAEGFTIEVEDSGPRVPATRTALPFVDGSDRSGRLPTYD